MSVTDLLVAAEKRIDNLTDTIIELRADLEKQRNVAVKYALIVEQFQKLLGVYTTTAALSKVAVLMREESVVDAEIASLRAELAAANKAVEELNKRSESYELELAGYRLALQRLQEMLTAHPEKEQE